MMVLCRLLSLFELLTTFAFILYKRRLQCTDHSLLAMLSQESSVQFNLASLPKWSPSNPNEIFPLKKCALNALDAGELMALSMEDSAMGRRTTPSCEWKKTIISICDNLDERNTCRFILQDTAGGKEASMGIIIDVLGPAVIPPRDGISFFRSDKAMEKKQTTSLDDESDEHEHGGQRGPILPCRFTVTNGAKDKKILKVVDVIQRGMNSGETNADGLPVYPNCNVSCTRQELELCQADLVKVRDNLTSKCKKKFDQSAMSKSGLFELSYIHMHCPEGGGRGVKMGKPCCAVEGCEKVGIKRCIKCRTPYCSQECQLYDWKHGHKPLCGERQKRAAANAEGSRPSVLLDPSHVPEFLQDTKVFIDMSLHGGVTGGKVGKDTLRYDADDFIVKVQGSPTGSGGSMLIYDEQRTFSLQAESSQGPGKDIFEFTCSCRVGSSSSPQHPAANVKCFLYASTEEGGLRIYLDALAPYQAW